MSVVTSRAFSLLFLYSLIGATQPLEGTCRKAHTERKIRHRTKGQWTGNNTWIKLFFLSFLHCGRMMTGLRDEGNSARLGQGWEGQATPGGGADLRFPFACRVGFWGYHSMGVWEMGFRQRPGGGERSLPPPPLSAGASGSTASTWLPSSLERRGGPRAQCKRSPKNTWFLYLDVT